MFITMLSRGWPLIVIAGLAIAGVLLQWPIEVMAVIMGVILIVGLAIIGVDAREKEVERNSQKLKELTGYFVRRFMLDSSLSIFVIIDTIFKVDNPKLWEWARACDMSSRVFNAWVNGLISRLESDNKTGRFSIYLRAYTNELWSINNLYYEYIEQFCEVVEKIEVPEETKEQYGKFVVEYNTFVTQFRELISEMRRVARTEIEPPSIKTAREVAPVTVQYSSLKNK
ncbi:MAG: hypothetical protein WCX07_00635 [Dehalococcoidales bacterium]|jgi:hypothetical protein|nr:hypothetical protein [Dehalococcoidales bacterium]MDD3994336.1 hypothetical protein [Dehalococcoidales bacterium]NLT28704.1 hypothetical protein [Dehalococcoidales bacterium]